MPRILMLLREAASRVAHRLATALGRVGDRCCPCCQSAVSGFVFHRYRPSHCPLCGSTPRERFVRYALEHDLLGKIPSGARILHVAPSELSLAQYFRSHGAYTAVDLSPERYEAPTSRGDLTRLDLPHRFDLIYASHVLEHIPDDATAMANLHDHLVPGGRALVLVPLRGEITEEAPQLTTARQRRERFGQADHVRQYGMDIVQRLEAAGFDVETVDAGQLDGDIIRQHGFETHGYRGEPESDRVFVCVRPAAAP
jgi:SAM-dependent methyltransferase